ncbi:MAG: arsenate reductase ArsC [Candidatus Hodarchaeales archaeon]|jgi:arsenate reductase
MERVLFICTHNSARSQIAEALFRHFRGDLYEVHSAGTQPSQVSPYAVQVMAEIGIDISHQRAKRTEEFQDMGLDHIITVCDHAKETCPIFPGGKNYHHASFEDPSTVDGTEEQNLQAFRSVRDQIKAWIEKTLLPDLGDADPLDRIS